jgi:hypothetical protein
VPGEIRPTSEETINTLVLHYCSLQPGERMPEDICISPVSLRRLRAKYNIAPSSRLESARARFREIQNVLPPPLRKHLTDPRNGFAMQLQSEAPITEIIASNPAK